MLREGDHNNWLRAFWWMIGATFLCFAAEAAYSTVRHYSIVQVVWTRYSVHLLCMLLLLGPRRFYRHLGTQRPMLHLGRGVLMIAMPLLGFAALAHLRAAEFKAVFWLLPLAVVAMARADGSQRIHIRHWGVVAMAYAGLLVIYQPTPATFKIDLLFALGSALSFGLYIVLTHRLQTTESLPTNLLYTAIAVIGPLTLLLPWFWQMPTLMDGAKMLMVGILGLASLWFIEKALEYSPPASLAPVLFLIPMWGMGVHLAWTRAVPGLSVLIGALAVTTSLVIHSILEDRAQVGHRNGSNQARHP